MWSHITFSTIPFELLILWQPGLVSWYIVISQRSCEKKKKTSFKVKGTVKVQNVNECLSRYYLLNHRTFSYQAWYGDASSWAGVSCKKTGLLSSRSRSQQGLIESKYDSFFYIFADSFATKLDLMVHHKPECRTKKLDCCIQGQGHSRTSKPQWMFVQIISSELLNLLPQNLVWWYIILSQNVIQKEWITFLGQGHSEGSKCQWMLVQMISSELLNLLPPNLVWWYIIMNQSVFQEGWITVFKLMVTVEDHVIRSWIVLWKGWIAVLWLRSRSQERFKISVSVHLDDIFSSAEPFVTKLGVVIHHHGPVSCKKMSLLSSRVHITEYDCFYHIY